MSNEKMINLDMFQTESSASSIKLRPYQERTLKAVKKSFVSGLKSVVMCAPTGAGKTIMFSWMCSENIARGKCPIIVVHREELMKQSLGVLRLMGMNPGKISAGHDPEPGHDVYVCMVETLYNRLTQCNKYLDNCVNTEIDLIILDEGHGRWYNKLIPLVENKFKGLMASSKSKRYVLCVTATPRYTSPGKPMRHFYQDIVEECDIEELIGHGFLVKDTTYGFTHDWSGLKVSNGDYSKQSQKDEFEKTELLGGVVNNFTKVCPWAKTICYNIDIEHSLMVTKEFERAGYKCRHLDSKMSDEDRAETLRAFSDDEFQILCNVGILTAGYDEPSVQCIIENFCTKSDTKHFQVCGRGGRPCKHWVQWENGECYINDDPKDAFYILDMGSNFERFGLWSDPYDWTGAFRDDKALKKPKKVPTLCPKCQFVFFGKECWKCGYVKPVLTQPRSKKYKDAVDGSLNVVKHRTVNPYNKGSVMYFVHMCAKKGYKSGWVYFQIKDKVSASEMPSRGDLESMVNEELARIINEKNTFEEKQKADEAERIKERVEPIKANSFSTSLQEAASRKLTLL